MSKTPVSSPQPQDAYERLADVYDLLGFHRFTQAAIRKCTDFLAESGLTVSRLLDLACGTGDFALAMAKLGIDVTGVDGAAKMLERARSKSRRTANAPRWLQGDFTSFRAPGRYDLVTCWFDSLNHLTTDAQLLACFRRVRRHLAPGGAFIFDVNTPHGFREGWSSSSFRSARNHAVVRRGFASPDGAFGWLEVEAFVKRGKNYVRIKIPFYQRGLTADIVEPLLLSAQFRDVRIRPFDENQRPGDATRLFVSALR
jgi:SAM-dependent methyltransferase